MATIELIGHLPSVVHAFSFIYGVSHAGNRLVMQQFIILSVGASSYVEAMKMGKEVYQQLMAVIKNKYVQDPTDVGDEGVSAPNIQEKKEGLELLKIAIDKAGYTNQVVIASDFAASEFYGSDKTYDLNFKEENNDGSQNISGDALKVLYKPVVFKDPFDQDRNTLLHKNLNHGGTRRMSVLTCTGQSSRSMEVDPYNAQGAKLPHKEEVIWKDFSRAFESYTRFFDELGFPIGARFEAMQELMRIAHEHDDNTIMKRSSVTFTDKDMVVAGEHYQLLYVAAKINGFDIMAVIDSGSSVNLMPLSTFKAVCIPEKSLVPEIISITGATGQVNSLGHVTFDLQVGPIRSEIRFDVMDTKLPCQILLGTPWIHKFEGVASTYHQCFKGKFKGKEVVIKASQTPFESYETHLLVPSFTKSPTHPWNSLAPYETS